MSALLDELAERLADARREAREADDAYQALDGRLVTEFALHMARCRAQDAHDYMCSLERSYDDAREALA